MIVDRRALGLLSRQRVVVGDTELRFAASLSKRNCKSESTAVIPMAPTWDPHSPDTTRHVS